MSTGSTIYAQLGGGRFVSMTGAKFLLEWNTGLSFKLSSRSTKDGINFVRITLNAMDLYDIEFVKVGPQPRPLHALAGKTAKIATVATVENVGADQLQSVFTNHTGLYVHL